MSPQDSQAWRPGLPANGRCGSRAAHSWDAAAMVSWRRALAQCSGARGAMLEVDPIPSVLLDLQVDPPPQALLILASFLQLCIFFHPTQRWALLLELVSRHPWNPMALKLSELWASCWGPYIYRAWNKWQ